MPIVALTTTRDNQVPEINPSFSDHIGFLIVIENGHLESVVVGRFMYSKAKFIVPVPVSILYYKTID